LFDADLAPLSQNRRRGKRAYTKAQPMKSHQVTGEFTPDEKRKLILELNLHFLPEQYSVTVHAEADGSVTATLLGPDGLSGQRHGLPSDFGMDRVRTAMRLANMIRGINRP
jgi:hypothetical protein